MKQEIHPEYQQINVTCSCGHAFTTGSTINHDLAIEVCAQCHPFYTGKQKSMSTGGRVQKYYNRYKPTKAPADSTSQNEANKA